MAACTLGVGGGGLPGSIGVLNVIAIPVLATILHTWRWSSVPGVVSWVNKTLCQRRKVCKWIKRSYIDRVGNMQEKEMHF